MSAGEYLLIDTGFFVALFNERDEYHDTAQELTKLLDVFSIIVPWPVLYETVNTRLTRRPKKLARFNVYTQSNQTVLLDDTPYRDISYDAVMQRIKMGNNMSLVDAVLCSVIEDKKALLRALLTFNSTDFMNVCSQNDVELVDEAWA